MPKIPIWRRYARLLGADPVEDVRDELRFHLQAKIDDLVSCGWDAAAARAEAERQFGDIQGVKSHGRTTGSRARRTGAEPRVLEMKFSQDVRFCLRMMRKQPASPPSRC